MKACHGKIRVAVRDRNPHPGDRPHPFQGEKRALPPADPRSDGAHGRRAGKMVSRPKDPTVPGKLPAAHRVFRVGDHGPAPSLQIASPRSIDRFSVIRLKPWDIANCSISLVGFER